MCHVQGECRKQPEKWIIYCKRFEHWNFVPDGYSILTACFCFQGTIKEPVFSYQGEGYFQIIATNYTNFYELIIETEK